MMENRFSSSRHSLDRALRWRRRQLSVWEWSLLTSLQRVLMLFAHASWRGKSNCRGSRTMSLLKWKSSFLQASDSTLVR